MEGLIMNNVQLVQDFINLKQLLDFIADFSSKNVADCVLSDKKRILRLILEHVSAPGTDSAVVSYLNKIQKYLSSDKPVNIQIIDDINTGVWDKELKDATDEIYRLTFLKDNFKLYHNLFERCSKLHFEENEYDLVRTTFVNKNYQEMLFHLFKHAFKKYQINLPTILSKRLYDEALTLSVNSDMRANLFRESADLGNKYAAIEYGECIYSVDINLATDYFIKGLPLQPALWELGYILEKRLVPPEKIKYLSTVDFYKKVCEPFFYSSPDSFKLYIEPNEDEIQAESLRMAFIIYFYLAHSDSVGFPKAFNSLGKLMINNRIAISANEDFYLKEETQKRGLDYLKKAIDLGNTNAMVNLANFYYVQNKSDNDFLNNHNVIPMLEVAASLGEIEANVLLADIYLSQGNVYAAKEYLSFAHSKGKPAASFKLGEVVESEGKYELALSYYKTAMESGYDNAAYNYVLLSSSPTYANNSNIPINRFYLSELLKKHINRMSDDIAARSTSYIIFLENSIFE